MLAASVACTLTGCAGKRVSLHDVLNPARGCLADRNGADMAVDDLLSAAKAKYVSLSFGYIGCGGRVPLLGRIRSAVAGAIGEPSLNIIFDAIDEPDRYPDVARDTLGEWAGNREPEYVRIAFVKKDELWPRQSNKAVQDMMQAMHVRFAAGSFLQTILQTGLFMRDGTFKGIHYL